VGIWPPQVLRAVGFVLAIEILDRAGNQANREIRGIKMKSKRMKNEI